MQKDVDIGAVHSFDKKRSKPTAACPPYPRTASLTILHASNIATFASKMPWKGIETVVEDLGFRISRQGHTSLISTFSQADIAPGADDAGVDLCGW